MEPRMLDKINDLIRKRQQVDTLRDEIDNIERELMLECKEILTKAGLHVRELTSLMTPF